MINIKHIHYHGQYNNNNEYCGRRYSLTLVMIFRGKNSINILETDKNRKHGNDTW